MSIHPELSANFVVQNGFGSIAKKVIKYLDPRTENVLVRTEILCEETIEEIDKVTAQLTYDVYDADIIVPEKQKTFAPDTETTDGTSTTTSTTILRAKTL
jgi:hypothetical protein